MPDLGLWSQESESPHMRQHMDHHLMNIGQAVRQALDPFGVDVDIDIQNSDGSRANVEKSFGEVNKAFREGKMDAKEAREAVKGLLKEAKAEAKAAKKDLKQAMKKKARMENDEDMEDLMEEPSTDESLMSQEAPKTQAVETTKTLEATKSLEVAKAMEAATPLEAAQPVEAEQVAEAAPPSKASTPGENKDESEGWTVLDKANSPEPSGADSLYPRIEAMDLSGLNPKVKVALQAMENMGFTNEGGWLSALLEKYDGDIGKVLDLLSPAKPVRA